MATSTVVEILPRQQLRVGDRAPGAYPTISRTGDRNRTGRNNVFFDDRNTVIFTSHGSSVSYPTTLPLGFWMLASNLTSSISTSNGAVQRNAVDQFIKIPSQIEPFLPFMEAKLSEQNLDKNGSFYLTGTDVSQVGLGFDAALGSKTIIRLAIPVTQDTAMDGTKASVFYFNLKTGAFEQVAKNRVAVPTAGSYPMLDVTMFDPFGNGTFGQFTSLSPFNTSNIGQEIPFALGLSPSDMPVPMALADNVYAPSASHLINMSQYIGHPFLLEKAIIEVPLKAGPGWLSDTTQYRSVSNSTDFWYDDGGGPCIVFSLQNSFPDRRDLILSATVIPAGDNTKNIRVDSIVDGANIAGGGTIGLRSFNGFSAVSTPTAVIQSASNGYFTGSAKMNAAVCVSNGVLTQKLFPFGIPQAASFSNCFSALINVFGRSGYPKQPSGRSYFGKEYCIPSNLQTVSNIRQMYGNPSGSSTYDYPDAFFYQANTISPYLILPNDKLIFCASKFRAILSNNGSNIFSPSLSHDVVLAKGTIHITLYGSLVQEGSEYQDTLNQRLETKEIHETIGMDPYLDKSQVEYFQVFSGSNISQQLTGTLLLPTTTIGQFTPNRRYIWADAANTSSFKQRLEIVEQATGQANYSDLNTLKKERFSLVRSTQLFSPNERFYDSLIPQLDGIFHVDGSKIFGVQFVTSPCGTPAAIGSPVVNLNFDFIPYPHDPGTGFSDLYTDVDWTKSYPFEPKYNSVTRILDVSQIIGEEAFVYLCGTGYLTSYQYKAANVNLSHTLAYTYAGESTAFFAVAANSIRLDTLTKLLYGFGDLNTYPTGNAAANITSACSSSLPTNFYSYGCTKSPRPRAIMNYGGIHGGGTTISPCIRSNVYRGTVIRGWKYGIVNGLPQYSKAIFNFKHFGMPRDMLEQRQDTKFYEALGYTFKGSLGGNISPLLSPVQVSFVNQKGEIVSPEYTYSSNLSTEATSSLPYFDGAVRNREEPINLSNLGLTAVI